MCYYLWFKVLKHTQLTTDNNIKFDIWIKGPSEKRHDYLKFWEADFLNVTLFSKVAFFFNYSNSTYHITINV